MCNWLNRYFSYLGSCIIRICIYTYSTKSLIQCITTSKTVTPPSLHPLIQPLPTKYLSIHVKCQFQASFNLYTYLHIPKRIEPLLHHITSQPRPNGLITTNFLAVPSINSSTDSASGFFPFPLSSRSERSLCKTVYTVGGAISTTRTLVPFGWLLRFMLQKCSQAFVLLQTGLMTENGKDPSTLDTLIMKALFGLLLRCGSSLTARCMGPRMLMSISQSAFARKSSLLCSCTSRDRCTPALLTRQSSSECSDVMRETNDGMAVMEPVSRTQSPAAPISFAVICRLDSVRPAMMTFHLSR